MAEFEGIPVSLTMLPTEIRQPIPIDITTDQFKARLKTGGTLTLIGNQLIVGEPTFSDNKFLFMALDLLELRKGASIVTGGNTVVIFTNRIISEDGKIISLLANQKKAKNGSNGNALGFPGLAGDPGDGGGFVSIHVIQDVEGILNVDLNGQDGGDAGNGIQGAKGAKGPKGEDSLTGPKLPWGVGCVREAGGGHKGGIGLPGGNGGNGGSSGQGGIFQLINIGPTPIGSASFTFIAKAGKPGNAGAGGPGGDGGDGGGGSLACHGANGGPLGDRGQNGFTGENGQLASDGQVIVKNLDLEVIVRIASNPNPLPLN